MILVGDNRVTIPTIERGRVQCIATSPPYFGLRLYGDAGEEIGKERDLGAYVQSIVDVMRLCRDALRDDGVAWVNLGDSYAPDGNALLVPFRVAMALQQDGWTLRAMLPWVKISGMPESVQSRPSMAHEYVLFLTKRPSGYFYDADAVRVGASATSHGGKPESATAGWSHRQSGAHHGGISNSLGTTAGASDRCDATPERARTLPPWWAYQDSAPLDLWSLPRPDVESGAANDPEVR